MSFFNDLKHANPFFLIAAIAAAAFVILHWVTG